MQTTDVPKLTGIHDAHIHARRDRMIEKCGVHGLADPVIAPETEGDVRDATAHLGVGQVGLDPAGRFDEVHGVPVVLLHARRDGEHVRVEDDVLGREADPVDQQRHLIADQPDVAARRGEDCEAGTVADGHEQDDATVHLHHGLHHAARVEAPSCPLREAHQPGCDGGELIAEHLCRGDCIRHVDFAAGKPLSQIGELLLQPPDGVHTDDDVRQLVADLDQEVGGRLRKLASPFSVLRGISSAR